MAVKKYYAVKKGKKTGIFTSWDECKENVDGYPGASYKSFKTFEEAEDFLGAASRENISFAKEDELLAYVDGSYEHSMKKYAFGCVFILADGRIYTEYGNGDNPESLKQRNVTGEMLGAMYAVRFAMANGFCSIEIRYDYEGIEKWVTGEWRSKTELTQKYAAAMREWSKKIAIRFTKVTAHSKEPFNELADEMAKTGLTQGNGIPKVQLLADMVPYGERNSFL